MNRVEKRVFGAISQTGAAVSFKLASEQVKKEENKRIYAIDKSKELR